MTNLHDNYELVFSTNGRFPFFFWGGGGGVTTGFLFLTTLNFADSPLPILYLLPVLRCKNKSHGCTSFCQTFTFFFALLSKHFRNSFQSMTKAFTKHSQSSWKAATNCFQRAGYTCLGFCGDFETEACGKVPFRSGAQSAWQKWWCIEDQAFITTELCSN